MQALQWEEAAPGGVMTFSASGFERAVEQLRETCRGGLPPEIEKLITRLDGLKLLLKDAEEQQASSHKARLWLEEVKQIFLDTEDLVDELATDAAVWSMMDVPAATPSAGVRIGEIGHILDHLDFYTPMIGLSREPSTVAEDRRIDLLRQTGSLLPYDATVIHRGDAAVIGRDQEKEQIKSWLLHSARDTETRSRDKFFSVISIVGMGGMGKTTLAQLVFNDEEVKRHFADLMMWVCVSNNFNPEVLTRGMLEAAFAHQGKPSPPMAELGSMQETLREEVERKNFLLVLDDVWEGDLSTWEQLLEPLHSGERGSRILVTSRDKAFVRKMPGFVQHHPPLEVQRLSDSDTWILFERYALYDVEHESEEYRKLEKIGNDIVKRLKGSPLAAKTIGSLLSRDLDVEHWKRVLESELWRLEQESDGILRALQLSYRYLSEDLKQCFAYCSLFPKDHTFQMKDVVPLWEAQSFIGRDRDSSRIGTAGSIYFEELLQRFFIETAKSQKTVYAMHDLVHDLAEYVSRDDCFRVEELKSTKIPSTVRHIHVHVTKFGSSDLSTLLNYKKLRTLLLPSVPYMEISLSNHDIDTLFQKLKVLRVLRLSHCGIRGELPGSIGDLKFLRYIDLTSNEFLAKLPESLGNLHNLQVLDLSRCSRVHGWPAAMSRLVNLQHLKGVDPRSFSDIDGLGRLTALQELHVRGRKVRELGGMCMLRNLKIWVLEEVESVEEASQARLHAMEHLQVLTLVWTGRRTTVRRTPKLEEEILQALRPSGGIRELLIDGYEGAKWPEWMQLPCLASFSSLRHVSLWNCCSLQDLLSSLSQLPHLEHLDIREMPEWDEWSRTGPVTRSCLVSRMLPWAWRRPVTSDGNQTSNSQHYASSTMLFFPSLCELRITNCPKLKRLPLLPPTLRHLHLKWVGLLCLPKLEPQHDHGGVRAGAAVSSQLPTDSATLSTLQISNCDKLTSMGGLLMQELPYLEEINVSDCRSLVSLPERGFGHLISLKRLLLIRCSKLTLPEVNEDEEDAPSQRLPCSLEELRIENCGDAMGGWWWVGLERLTSITELALEGCPATAESLFVGLGRHARRSGHSSLPLKTLRIGECGRGCNEQEEPAISQSPPASPLPDATASAMGSLTSLTDLTIYHSPNFLRKWGRGGLPKSLQRLTINKHDDLDQECLSDCLSNLTSLRNLRLENLRNLRSMPHAMGSLSSLKRLHISGCSPILSPPTVSLPSSLEQLTIENDDNVDHEGLSTCLHNLSSLGHLTLVNLKNLSCLPNNLDALSSLYRLEIVACPMIQSAPTSGLPPSLKKLTINNSMFGSQSSISFLLPELAKSHRNLPRSMWPIFFFCTCVCGVLIPIAYRLAHFNS